MRPVLPIHLSDVDQTDIGLVHERRGLEAVTDALPSHAALRDPMKLPFDHGDQARQRLYRRRPATPGASPLHREAVQQCAHSIRLFGRF